MSETQSRLLTFRAQQLEMEAHDASNEAARHEATARDLRSRQELLLAEAADLRAIEPIAADA